jgi:NADH:ubiquinone oxidoreductase subunit D
MPPGFAQTNTNQLTDLDGVTVPGRAQALRVGMGDLSRADSGTLRGNTPTFQVGASQGISQGSRMRLALSTRALACRRF